MAKIQTVGKISEVMGIDWLQKSDLTKSISRIAESFGKTAIGFAAVMPLNKAFAASAAAVNGCIQGGATSSTFLNLHGSVMNMFSAGVVLVIIFAGAAWAMGHRGKALELLIGCSCGFILAIHAIDIRNFLSCI